MKMRRNVMILAVVALVAFAGSAFAHGHGGWGGGHRMGGTDAALCGEGGFGGGPQGEPRGQGTRMMGKDVPQAIRNLMNEAHRTNLQLRLALTEDKVDAAKAKALFEKAQELRGKIARWRFEESLKRKNPAN